jgi:hypothetical protein
MSNFASIQIGVLQPGTNYGQNFPVVAEIVKIAKVEQGYTLVVLRDFSGVENTALIRGKVRPAYANIGQVSVFALAGKTSTRGVDYSGFYNPQEPVPPELAGKRPPAPPASSGQQVTGNGGTRASGGSDAKNRSMALAYAKDLVVAGKIVFLDLAKYARSFARYLDTGEFKLAPVQQAAPVQAGYAPQPQQAPVQQAAQIEAEIPEMGGVQADPYAGGNTDPYGQGPAVGQPVQTAAQPEVPYSDEDIPF